MNVRSENSMLPRLIAFDLDGTLLTEDKQLSTANRNALLDMHERGVVVVLASGRLGSAMMRYAQQLPFECPMLTLNGAMVYRGWAGHSEIVCSSCLEAVYAEELAAYSERAGNSDFILNYYFNDKLYTVESNRGNRWVDLYVQQTGSEYLYLQSNATIRGISPSKCILVGDRIRLDAVEKEFRNRFDGAVYIVRTWRHYLEFLHRQANKGTGIAALAKCLGISSAQCVAFGDSDNDVPMLQVCGLGISLKNGTPMIRDAADRVSPWTNDEDGVAHEWERIKAEA
jgi:hypothetical protein